MDGRSNKRLEATIWAWLKIGQCEANIKGVVPTIWGWYSHLFTNHLNLWQYWRLSTALGLPQGMGENIQNPSKHLVLTSGVMDVHPASPKCYWSMRWFARQIHSTELSSHHCSASFNEECEELCQSAILSAVRRIWTSKSHCLRKSLERPTKGIWVSSNMKGVPLYMVIWMGNLRF